MNCTFAPTISATSRQILGGDLEGASLEPGTRLTQTQVEEFVARQMEHQRAAERKLSTQRQAREKEHEQLTFTPAVIAKEMKGVESVVGSYSRKCSTRPKPAVEFGASARGGATSRSPDPAKGLAALSRKNSRAIQDYLERQKKAQDMKEYLDEMDPLNSRHREPGWATAKTQRGCKTARNTKRDASQKPSETQALKHSKSIISEEKNAKPISTSKKSKNTSQAVINGPKKVKKALQQSMISIG